MLRRAALRFRSARAYSGRARPVVTAMPLHDLPLILVTRALVDGGDGPHVAEALGFPEFLGIEADADRLHGALRSLAREILSKSAPLDVHRRVIAATPTSGSLTVSIKPPKPSPAWREPIDLTLDVLRWRHGDDAAIAYVPALGIEVVAARDDALDPLVEQHVRVALAREKLTERLLDLAQLARVRSITIDRQVLTADIPTPAQIAAENVSETQDPKPVIADVGAVLDDAHVEPAYEIDPLVERLADTLVGRHPRSVLMVGPSGVGKTAAFHQLFLRHDLRLAATPFWMTSGARLIAGASGYGLWQERCQRLCRQAKAAGAILHLGNLVELMEVGKAGGSSTGLANFFRPYLARRDTLAVAECAPEQLPLIEQSNPHLLTAFEVIQVAAPTAESERAILTRAAEAFANAQGDGRDSVITPDAVDRLQRLHQRYATYSAAPGRPLRFLRNLIEDRRTSAPPAHARETATTSPLTTADVTAAFSRETGLPLALLDDAVPLDLDAAREHFGARVIGQSEAVDLVTDLLATVKAAMNRPRRPIASLLFLGPTGVGKTEMAKALSEYFFGDATGRRLVRFDMSEFASAAAVARLIGTAWETQGVLTARVREEPFCVLLFDEFEKAHPAFFDLLLQVLGEARLTDAAGRLADFSNAVIVMTSNLGAESFGAGPFGLARATASGEAHARAHFTRAVQDHLRPELFNRIDRVVPFLPLGPETIERIAAREIELISRRDGVRQRDLNLDVSPAAIRHFAQAGYDPLYGARPLKRRIERDLLAPLADAANQYAQATPLDATVDVVDGLLCVAVATRPAAPGTTEKLAATSAQASTTASLRRTWQAVARSPAASALNNELFNLRRLFLRQEALPQRRIVEPAHRERHKRLDAISQAMARLGRDLVTLEDALLLHLYEDAPLPASPERRPLDIQRFGVGVQELKLHLFALDQPHPDAITLALFGNAHQPLFMMARTYYELVVDTLAAPRAPGVELFDAARASPQSHPPPAVSYFTRLGKTTVQRTPLDPKHAEPFLAEPRGGVLGILLEIHAPFALARFQTEAGIHLVEEERGKPSFPILVDTSTQPATAYQPPKDVEFRVALTGQRRRTYTLNRGEAEDAVTGKTYRWSSRSIQPALTQAIEDRLWSRIDADTEQ